MRERWERNKSKIEPSPGEEDDPERYFVPPYVGVHGWVGVHLDRDPDWEYIADLIADSYRMTAPKRLVKQLDEIRHSGD
jgi:hypothetical protein